MRYNSQLKKDEVGRGSLIGRLYVGCAVMPAEGGFDPALVTDSKKLKGKKLQRAYEHVKATALYWTVQWAEMEEVDEANVTQATVNAWHRCLEAADAAGFRYDEIIVDGSYFRPYRDRAHACVPKADATHPCVAAASILAKVERDA